MCQLRILFAKTLLKTISLLILLHKVTLEEFDLKFHQNDYRLVVERVETVEYNKRYMHPSAMKSFKYNRTTVAMNGTLHFKIHIGYDLDMVLQAYKFASNEYRYFPLRMGARFCDILKADFAGVKMIFKCGNFSGCPFLKNVNYHICNFTPNDLNLPPLIPTGRYMMETQFLHNSTEMISLKYFFAISRPIVWDV